MRVVASAVLVSFLLGCGLWSAGVVYCAGESMPRGLYIKVPRDPLRLYVGDIVLACVSSPSLVELARDRGYLAPGPCAGQSARLIKRVAAAEGDRIRITLTGVTVNGRRWPASAPLQVDHLGRPLPSLDSLDLILGSEEVFLMSDDAAEGFDGRYLGVTSIADVLQVLAPLVTWQGRG